MASMYKNLTASALVKEGPGKLVGVFVASASSTPTLKFWDAMSATAPVLLNTFTPIAGTQYNFPELQFTRGLYVTASGTLDATVEYE